MNEILSLMMFKAALTHAYSIACFGLIVHGVGIAGSYHVRSWALHRDRPFVCTSVNFKKYTTKEIITRKPSPITASILPTIDSTFEGSSTSQETGSEKTSSQLNVYMTFGNQASSDGTDVLSTKQTTYSLDETTTVTSPSALAPTTDREIKSTEQITTNPTTKQKIATVALETTTESQTSSTSQFTTDSTTMQITSTVGLTTLAAANRVCHHSKPPYCYEFVYEKKTYADSYHYCRGLGAGSNLVSMSDANEADDVKKLIADHSSQPTEDYWIGLGRTRYSWDDGKTLLYHNFASDYVNGVCTVMDNNSFKWKSIACNSNQKTVCESNKGSQICDIEFDGSCYYLLGSTSTKATAKGTCEGSGGHVLQIETKGEQLFIQGQFSIGHDIWIDLKSDGGNGFTWVDGTSYGYNYFGSNYENNHGVCFRIDYNDGFHWNDRECDSLHNFICKWNL